MITYRIKQMKNFFQFKNSCIFPMVDKQITRIICTGIGLSLIPMALYSSFYLCKKILIAGEPTILITNESTESTISHHRHGSYRNEYHKIERNIDETDNKLEPIKINPNILDKMCGAIYPLALIGQVKLGQWQCKMALQLFKMNFQKIQSHLNILKTTSECCIIIRKTSRLTIQIPALIAFYTLCIPNIFCTLPLVHMSIIFYYKYSDNNLENHYQVKNRIHENTWWL